MVRDELTLIAAIALAATGGSALAQTSSNTATSDTSTQARQGHERTY